MVESPGLLLGEAALGGAAARASDGGCGEGRVPSLPSPGGHRGEQLEQSQLFGGSVAPGGGSDGQERSGFGQRNLPEATERYPVLARRDLRRTLMLHSSARFLGNKLC